MMHLPSLLQFLSGLAENNNRPWFLHNKPQFDILKEEFTELVAAVGVKVRKFDKELPPFEAKKAVFRIYRDVRFSKDKLPYKTHMGAVVGLRNMSDKTRPVHYFHIDHNGTLLIASGIYNPPPDVLKTLRDHIVANPAALTRALKNPQFKKVFGDLSDEGRMSRVPKGYDKEHPHAAYLMNRNYFCETTFDLTKRAPKDLPGKIAETLEAAMPVVNWLRGIKTK
jgi:uncharacterized protein (TIGR02453 family)